MRARMSEFDRAWAFVEDLYQRAAERTVPFPYGWAVLNDRLPRVHDLNFLCLQRAGPVDELIAASDEIMSPRTHRVFWMPDGNELQPVFRERGWQCERYILLAHHRKSDRPPRVAVEEVTHEDLLPVWEEGIASEAFAKNDPDLVRQLVEHKRVIADAVPTRYFAARVGGEIAGYCELYERDGIAQPEAVMTLERFRNRGIARAVVLRAVEVARTNGADLIFIVAHENDWPQQLYRRLGFDDIGSYTKFMRLG
jgi:ribosomal protein S18 acetylase RimI-like enzyme